MSDLVKEIHDVIKALAIVTDEHTKAWVIDFLANRELNMTTLSTVKKYLEGGGLDFSEL